MRIRMRKRGTSVCDKDSPYTLDLPSLARRLRKAIGDYRDAVDGNAPTVDILVAGDALVNAAEDAEAWLEDNAPGYPDELRREWYGYVPLDDDDQRPR